ncbi:MAG: cyclase family protein [Bryobacteraceae bacterium]
MKNLLDTLRSARVYDLAQPYFIGMPHHPVHPPFLFSLSKKHGDYVTPAGASSAAEAITLGGHVGTHIDALCHFSRNGMLHGGAAPTQSYAAGIAEHSVDTIAPILRRGVLLDIAGDAPLPAEYSVTPADIEAACARQGVTVQDGDVVLLRTGWAQLWNDPVRYIAQVRGPGPEADAARWLSAKKIFAAGSDTIAFEKVPAPDMPVHVHLLVESGIHIIEALNLEELARDRVFEFLFIAAPLKIRGGTGSPIRPLAVREAA